MSNVKIYFIVVAIAIILRRSLDESAGHFLQPEEFKNVANPYFENIKHLQNPGHVLLTAASTFNIRSQLMDLKRVTKLNGSHSQTVKLKHK